MIAQSSIYSPLLFPISSVFGSANGGAPLPDVLLKVLATRVYGPGYNSGAAPLTGDGTQKTYSSTTSVNLSGAAMATCSVVLQGWTLRTVGFSDTGNDFTVQGTIEYPVGTTVGTIAPTNVVNGSNTETADIVLSTPIPAGATFAVKLNSTVPNGLKYIPNLGYAGVRNHALASALVKVRMGGFGDSIMTNNNGAIMNASAGRCPTYLNSIIGTLARDYGDDINAHFARQKDLVQKLGLTHVFSNFGTNDFGAGIALATLQGYLTNMRDAVRAVGAKWVHMTMTPRVSGTPAGIAVSSMTSSGNTITAVVADATKFIAGKSYAVAGANETEYNGSAICLSVNTGTNTITLLFEGSATPTATGTITIGPWRATSAAAFQTPTSAFYNAGPASARGLFNAWIRGGAFDSFIDWADAVEPSRDSGRWKVEGEDALLPTIQLVTVSSVISTSRFNSNYDRGNSTIANGYVLPLTGANIGVAKSGNGNTAGDITVTAAWANAQQVGDQYYAVPGVSYMSDDGLHPRVSGGGKGGQVMLDNAVTTWLNTALA
jgi:hypothetical protein